MKSRLILASLAIACVVAPGVVSSDMCGAAKTNVENNCRFGENSSCKTARQMEAAICADQPDKTKDNEDDSSEPDSQRASNGSEGGSSGNQRSNERSTGGSQVSCVQVRADRYGHFTLQNSCDYDVIVFYCGVYPASNDGRNDEQGFDCRDGESRSAFSPDADFGMSFVRSRVQLQEGDRRFKASAIAEAQQIDYNPELRARRLAGAERIIRGGPLATYKLRPGDEWEGVEVMTSDIPDQKSVMFISSCALNDFTARSCMPDAPAFWRFLGSPMTYDSAVIALARWKQQRR